MRTGEQSVNGRSVLLRGPYEGTTASSLRSGRFSRMRTDRIRGPWDLRPFRWLRDNVVDLIEAILNSLPPGV
jgi:hypothetical protein